MVRALRLAVAVCLLCGSSAGAATPTWPPAGFVAASTPQAFIGGLPVFPACPTFRWQLVTTNVWLSTPSATDPPTLAGTLPIAPTPAPIYTWTCPAPMPDGTYYLSLSSVNTEGTESVRSVPVGFIIGSPTPPAVIGVGSPIFVNTAVGVLLNVRATAGGAILGTQPRGATGTVTGGPTAISGVTWWQIAYTNAPSGWSSGTYLSLTAP